MDWENIIILIIGGAIAIVTNYFTNRYQLQRWREERDEQRREATIQLALELTRSNLKVIEDLIDMILKATNTLYDYRTKKEYLNFTEEALQQEIDSSLYDENGKLYNFADLNAIGNKIAYSLGVEFQTEYQNLFTEWGEYVEYILKSSSWDYESERELRRKIALRAGKIHSMLEEKLISIRDSE